MFVFWLSHLIRPLNGKKKKEKKQCGQRNPPCIKSGLIGGEPMDVLPTPLNGMGSLRIPLARANLMLEETLPVVPVDGY
jgi:hypothetical protein